jgi:hypothetical protein
LDPTQIINVAAVIDDDDKTIVTSNWTHNGPNELKRNDTTRKLMASTAQELFGAPNPQYLNAITITTSQAIADTGATPIFIMEGTPCDNLQPTIRPLTINLPDGTKTKSTHTCDITIPGLPMVLVGHIVPKLSIALLIASEFCVTLDAKCYLQKQIATSGIKAKSF